MKYIINESRLESAITEYLNKIFPLDNVYLTNPTEYDDETGENYDDDTRIEFYLGDYEIYIVASTIFAICKDGIPVCTTS